MHYIHIMQISAPLWTGANKPVPKRRKPCLRMWTSTRFRASSLITLALQIARTKERREGLIMFDAQRLVTAAFVDHLIDAFRRAFPTPNPQLEGVLEHACRSSLETLANTDAAYHNTNHTLLVTDVGQTILYGRIISQGDLTQEDWLHAIIAMLFHDIGYVRGSLKDDRSGDYLINAAGERLQPPPGATDACLTPFHVDRSQLHIAQRFATESLLDVAVISDYIEMTRFPVPEEPFYQRVGDIGGLVRAADLIGQLADPCYLQKLSLLYAEFCETGDAERMGYQNAGHLRSTYPAFFYQKVSPYITEGIRFLHKSNAGKAWIAQLYAHVFTEQHQEQSFGPERIEISPAEIAIMALPARAG